jgi:type II secretory pathway pseudopilin PulG
MGALTSLRVRLGREEGMTLPEMAVVTLLLGMVMAFVLGAVAAFERSATGGIRRLENLDEARVLMAVITKDIRTAAKLDSATPPFLLSADPDVTLADDNEVTFYANLNLTTPCPKRIHLYVNARRELIEEVTQPDAGGVPPDCTYTQNAPTTRLVGQYVANDLADPAEAIFTYYYEEADGTLTAFPPEATPLSASDALLVEAVGIRLKIRKSTALPVADTTLVNRVRLPNVFYNPPPTPSP